MMDMIYLIGVISPNLLTIFTALQLESKPVNSSVNLFINSRGGDIDMAQGMADTIRTRQLWVTCFVDKASSAALQIVLPACHRIYMHDGTQLVYHDAHALVEGMISSATANEIRLDLIQTNRQMAQQVEARFGKARCRVLKSPRVGCTLQHIYDNTPMGPHEWKWTYPQTAQQIVVIPEFLFASHRPR